MTGLVRGGRCRRQICPRQRLASRGAAADRLCLSASARYQHYARQGRRAERGEH